MKINVQYALGRQLKFFLLAFLILTIVTSAIELKGKAKGQGNLFCIDNGTTCSGRVDFQEWCTGDGSRPCGSTAGVANLVYKQITCDCVVATGPFIQAASQ